MKLDHLLETDDHEDLQFEFQLVAKRIGALVKQYLGNYLGDGYRAMLKGDSEPANLSIIYSSSHLTLKHDPMDAYWTEISLHLNTFGEEPTWDVRATLDADEWVKLPHRELFHRKSKVYPLKDRKLAIKQAEEVIKAMKDILDISAWTDV